MELNTEPLCGVNTGVITLGIVDNVPLVVNGFKEFLNSLEGMQVILTATDGRSLLDQLQQGHPLPDLLLVDIMMPIMNGLELSQVLRQQYPSIKVIAFSSVPADIGAAKMLRAGCYDYMLKGCSAQEMEAVIREVYNRPEVLVDVGEEEEELIAFSSQEIDRMLLHCIGYEQQAFSEHVEQRLEVLREVQQESREQQRTIAYRLGQLLSVITKAFRRRKKYLIFTDGHRKVSIAIRDIIKISAQRDYVRVHVVGNTPSRLYLSTLGEVEADSAGTDLLRVNRSTIVNRKYIAYVERKELIGIAGEEVALQKKYADAFLLSVGIEK